MDNASPSPPKRPRTIDFLTSQLGKPVRYFPFNKKSAGIVQQEKFRRLERVPKIRSQHVVSSSLSGLPFSSTMKFVPNKEANISNKLQKLKLKSPDGRDLGEINVQLLPQKSDGIGGKTIMLQKHSLFGKLDNPAAVSILKPIEKNKQATINGPISLVQTTGAQGNFITSGTSCVSVNTMRMINSGRETGTGKPLFNVKHKIESQQTTMLTRHLDLSKHSPAPLGSKVFFINVDKQTGLNTVKASSNDARILTQTASNQKIIVVHAENYPDSTEGKKNNSFGSSIELRIPPSSKDDSGTETASSTSNLRTVPSVFWNPSKFSEFKSQLSNQKSKASENETVHNVGNNASDKAITITQSVDSEHVKTAGKSLTLSTSSFNKKQSPKFNSWTILKTSGKKLENGRKSSCEGESEGNASPRNSLETPKSSQTKTATVSNVNSENTQNVTSTTSNVLHPVDGKQVDENIPMNTELANSKETPINDQNLRENIMVILHGDMNTLQNNSEQMETSKETNSMEVDKATSSNAYLTHDDSAVDKSADVSNRNSNSSTPGTVLPKQQNLDIIQQALSACTDQDLREKALKALADCGIGVKRDVPVLATMSVSDSQTQTRVFSLMKPEMVEYNEASPILNTLNVIDKSDTLLQNPSDLNTESLDNLILMNSDGFDLPNDALPIDFSEELDKLLSDNSKDGVNQIKNIFSKPDPLILKAYTQIQKDFQAATTTDTNGMMGIHRAVLSGNIKEVQRQLIVLRAVKESIEVPTADGKTSLELAVLHAVDPRIVQALISAGAKPAVPLKLHESALVIACKMSSAVLPELIKHVTPSTLFDMMDSEGFAPLHYCAQLGNSHGVKLLMSAGANVNLRDAKSGRTALFHALESRHIEIAWHLLDNGASPNITNFAGQSAAALVDEYRHNSLAEKFNQAVR